VIRRTVGWLDDRLGVDSFVRRSLNKVFPDHWSFLIGEVALYAFLTLLVTGTYLTFFFNPGQGRVVYDGGYAPLHGEQMSQAYESVLRLSFDVRAGLVMRQIHHWAALVFIAAVIVHLCRVFFTGAFRRPRELNWVVGVTLMLLAIGNGFTGYSLPDDLLSGTGLRIMNAILLSVPLVGDRLAYLVFGGEYPGDVIARLYVIHILIVPALIAGLLTAHLAMVWRQKHTQFAGPGRAEDNVVGTRLWPTYAAKSAGLLFLVAGVLAGLGGLVQINPIWLYGPYHPAGAGVTAGSQPDWYIGWLEGALRLFPAWEVRAFGHTLPSVLFPGVLLPGLTFAVMYGWPWLEARLSRDRAAHHILDAPNERPRRTAFGAAVLTFYFVLFVAGGNDVLAAFFHVSLNATTQGLRVAAIAGPLVVYAVTWRVCRELRGGARLAPDGRAREVVRTPAGGYAEDA
jgi:ubiquinol-cytochrome c reductase cytochrome b subunit